MLSWVKHAPKFLKVVFKILWLKISMILFTEILKGIKFLNDEIFSEYNIPTIWSTSNDRIEETLKITLSTCKKSFLMNVVVRGHL